MIDNKLLFDYHRDCGGRIVEPRCVAALPNNCSCILSIFGLKIFPVTSVQ